MNTSPNPMPARRIAVLAGCLLTWSVLAAGSPEPVEDPWREMALPTLKVAPASELHLGRYVMRLERTSLYDILKDFTSPSQPRQVSHKENNDESINWLCFDLADGQRLWFVADADSGGAKFTVTRLAAEQLGVGQHSEACPPPPSGFGAATLDHGVWLGTRGSDLIAMYGQPSERKDDWLSFYYEQRIVHKRRKPDSNGEMFDDFDASSYLNVRIVGGKVTQLVAGKLTGE